jgi:hypothetical protein
MSLEQRIARLEALEDIRQLKHRYLNACDLKQVEVIADCFAEGEVLIDYGPLGIFRERDSFVGLYRELACHARVIDLHHGANPEIEVLSEDQAQGRWALWYFNVDARAGRRGSWAGSIRTVTSASPANGRSSPPALPLTRKWRAPEDRSPQRWPLWERACSRWRPVRRHQRWMCRPHREQARSHNDFWISADAAYTP